MACQSALAWHHVAAGPRLDATSNLTLGLSAACKASQGHARKSFARRHCWTCCGGIAGACDQLLMIVKLVEPCIRLILVPMLCQQLLPCAEHLLPYPFAPSTGRSILLMVSNLDSKKSVVPNLRGRSAQGLPPRAPGPQPPLQPPLVGPQAAGLGLQELGME